MLDTQGTLLYTVWQEAMHMTSPNDLPTRICKLKECGKTFQPVTSWHDFHTAACRNRYNWLERRTAMQFMREQQKVTR